MSIFSALSSTTLADGSTEAERLAAEVAHAEAFTARSGALAPTHDLLGADQQAALNGVIDALAVRGTTLRGYQHAAVETALHYRRVVLGFAPGLGKTLTVTTAWAAERAAGATGSLLVVCPPHLVPNWVGDVAKHHPALTVTAVQGTKQAALPTGSDILVLPDSVVFARRDDVLAAVASGTVTAMAFDEAHRFKSNRHQTKRAHAALLVSNALHQQDADALVFSMTGTLVANYPADVVQPVALCGPEVTKRLSASGGWDKEIGHTGYASFRSYWSDGEYKRLPSGELVLEKVTGCKNPEALNAELTAAAYLWVDRYEVTDLDPVTWVSQPADCTETFPEHVYEIRSNFLSWVEEQHGLGAKERASRAEQLVKLDKMRKHEALAKTEQTVSVVADLVAQAEQVVVFAWHKECVWALGAALAKRGIQYGTITGASTAKQKRQTQIDFQSGAFPVVICNISSASTGIDLDSPTSRTVLFHQLPWTPSDLVQAAGRVERLTQTRSCVAIMPLATDNGEVSFEERLSAILTTKVAVADAVNNGNRAETMAERLAAEEASVVGALMATYGWEDYG